MASIQKLPLILANDPPQGQSIGVNTHYNIANSVVNYFHLSVLMATEYNSKKPHVYTPIPRFLLEYGMDVNEHSKRRIVGFADTTGNDTALHKAIEGKGSEDRYFFNGRLPLASLLLEWGARVHAKDYVGRTPLHFAAIKGDSTLMQLLLDHKADVNANTNTGQTPLHLAIQWYNFCPKAVNILLDRGADVNAVDGEGLNALYTASKCPDPEIVKILLDAGATVNASSNGGYATLGAALGQIGCSCELSII
jgi:hypothetical protein